MTFDNLKTEIKDRLLITSTASDTRIGRLIQKIYREITTSIGLNISRHVNTSEVVTVGNPEVTFSEVEKIERIWYTSSGGSPRILKEVMLGELREITNPSSDKPTKYAVIQVTSNTVKIRLDANPATAYTLQADGTAEVADLSGSNEPAFPESFHDIIIEGVLKDEYRKLEKIPLARESEATFQRRLSDLRMFIAKSAYLDIQQGKLSEDASSSTAGSGGTSSTLGISPLTITGLYTFSRGSAVAPFAVSNTDATYVVNLGAEFLGNITTDRLIGRDTAATGESEQLTVGGGIEFTGSGGIQTAAFTGDVTKTAGGTALTIPNDTVTYAKMQNVSATDRILGRDTAAAGDVEELTVGNGLEFTGSGGIGIADAGVTYTRIQDVSAASRILGRGSASGAGDVEELTAGTGLTISGTTLSVSVTDNLNVCEGRLTLTSATPVTTSDVTAASTVYWALYKGDRVALYTGSVWTLVTLTELSVAVPATTATMYDVFIDYNGGTPQLVATAWTNDTTRATALTTQNGVLVQTGNLDWRYVGSFRTTGVSGETEDSLVKRYVWNYYNRVPRTMRAIESANSWQYTSVTFQQANANTANQLDFIIGVAEVEVEADVVALAQNTDTTGITVYVNIGEDSTTAATSGFIGGATALHPVGSRAITVRAALKHYPAVGRHFWAWLEASTATGTTTWLGDNASETNIQSGIHGSLLG